MTMVGRLSPNANSFREAGDGSASKAFFNEVKAEVAAHFAATGVSPYASASMVLKSVILVGAYFGSYAAIVSGQLPLWAAWLLCPVMGAAMAGVGFAVAHDALHGAYSENPRVNRAVGLLFDAIGANGFVWRQGHNGAHHSYPNVLGLDEDVAVSPLLRLSPLTERRGFHRFQHLFAFPLYALTTLNWMLIGDFLYFGRSLFDRRQAAIPASAWFGLFAGKLIAFATLAAPFFLLPLAPWQVCIGILSVHLTAGVIIGGVFQLAHIVEATEHREAGDAVEVRGNHAAHQLKTTCNFAPSNGPLTWYIGGLNFQVEHHLFPRICHAHYPRLSPIVRRIAERHGLPYNSTPTLFQAIGSHLRTLKALGAPFAVRAAEVAPA